MVSEHEIDVGQLSGLEAVIAQDRDDAREQYGRLLETARVAARELDAFLSGGIPELRADGGPRMQREARRRVNSYRWASLALRRAAERVCDVEELADDGAAEGIVWEVDL